MSQKPNKKSDKGISREELMEGVPFFNIGAMFMPPIWGPAHGIWLTIVFYPLWIVADSSLWAAYTNPTPLSIAAALGVFVLGVAATLMFAHTCQWHGLVRAFERGHDKEWYLKRQKAWAIFCVIFAIVLIAIATWFNLTMRAGLEMQ